LPIGSSDLPGGRSNTEISNSKFKIPELLRAGSPVTPPYLILHREEFAWPRMSPHAPVRSYIKPLRAAPFHPSPRLEISDLKSQNPKPVGWCFFCCTCRHRNSPDRQSQIQDL